MGTPDVNLERVKIHRDYETNLFVKRNELEIIKYQISQAEGGSVAKPIINFWGVTGIGKTWLLYYLNEKYRYDSVIARTGPLLNKPTFTMYHAFSQKDPASVRSEAIVKSLAQDILVQLEPVLSPDDHKQLLQDEGEGNLQGLVKLLIRLSQHYVPLVLFDNAEVIPDEAREFLEQYLIEPLAVTDRILIILAGRRRIPRWQRFEVRRRVMKPEETQVHAFDEMSMREQAKLSQYNVPIKWIYRYTAGNPHLANVIAWHINEWTEGQKPSPDWLKEYQQAFAPILQTYEENILERVPKNLHGPLYAIAPLRFYRLEAMRYMLNISDQPDSFYLKILQDLDQKTEIVWWSHPRRSYVTDEIVRQIINRRQLLESREEFIGWHQHAYAMYRERIEKYKETSEDFIVEAWFHLANIYLATEDEIELRAKVEALIDFAQENLSPDRLLVLRKSLEKDNGEKEMLELFPEDLCQYIRKQLV